ncbi:MAG: IgGFc-binding protein [Bradymonadales bacterium]|nr:IgGFc-binding protein [Bradymonadales bacterium]
MASIAAARPGNQRWFPILAMVTAMLGCGTPDEEPVDIGLDVAQDLVLDPDAPADLSDLDLPSSRCTPGARRCISDHLAEICNEQGEWEQVPCADDELCWAGQCGQVGTCDPYEVQECLSYDRYRGCNPIGTGYGEFAVPFNMTCIVDGEGVHQMVVRMCFQGQTRCQDEQVLLRCAPSGLEWEEATNCTLQDPTTVCDEGRCITLCQYMAKRDTYVGCEYWAVDLDNAFVSAGHSGYYDAAGAQFAVAVSNYSAILTAEVTIEDAYEILAEGTVPPGHMVVFELPPARIEGTMHGLEAYRITSTVPIVAYQFNPLEDEEVFSNDASLLLPTSSLGTDYLVMTRRQTFEQLKCTLTVVAVEEGTTEVTVTLPPRTDANPLYTLAGSDIPALQGGDTLVWNLQQFELLNLETNRLGADLTGTVVQSTRPVVVFPGSEASNAPNTDDCVYRQRQQDWVCAWDRETPCWDPDRQEPNIGYCSNFITCCADHLEEQMLPIFAWGRSFNAVRSAPRGDEADVWRIMAGADEVQVTLFGMPDAVGEPILTTYQIDTGEWFDFESRADFEIAATGPIFVGQFLAAELAPSPHSVPNPPEFPHDAGTGDPAFITVVPREQYRSDYIFLVPGEYAHNWVSIVVPAGSDVNHTDEVGSEVIDGDRFEPFASGQFAALRYELVNEGYHRLWAEQPFGVMVHGYDQYVSYGYPAGLDIKKINQR